MVKVARPCRLQRLHEKVFSISRAEVRRVAQSDLCSAHVALALRWRMEVRGHR